MNMFASDSMEFMSFNLHESFVTELEQKMIKAGISAKESNTSAQYEDVQVVVVKENFFNKKLSRIIERAIQDKQNPINLLVVEFRKIFLRHFKEERKEVEYKVKEQKSFIPKSVNQRCEQTKTAFLSLQRFVKLMIYCLNYMYTPILGTDKFLFLKEFLVSSIVEILVDNEVYKIIFSLFRMEDDIEERILEIRMKELSEIKPEDLSINPHLCLNEAVLNDKVLSGIAKESNNLKVDWKEKLRKRIEEYPYPYKEAVNKLKEITFLINPMEKLQCIVNLNSMICCCIDKFWVDIPVPREKLLIDADQYLSILVYILIKANTKDLFTHITVSNEFANLGSASSYNAYSLVTLQASFYHLLNINLETTIIENKVEECKET